MILIFYMRVITISLNLKKNQKEHGQRCTISLIKNNNVWKEFGQKEKKKKRMARTSSFIFCESWIFIRM